MPPAKINVPYLRSMPAKGEKITMMTAYDYPTAAIVDEAGVEIILVGDSLGMVVLGYDSTIPVTMDEMIHHTKAARRGTRRALLVGDMPFLSYGTDVRESVRNAGRFVKEAGAEAVKLEGGERCLRDIEAITRAQIPVMAHLGLTPQSMHVMGGYKVQAQSAELADQLLADARAIESAGAFSLVLEGIPREVAAYITASIDLPTIGIGAGPDCDGQVLVFHDLLGFHGGYYPKFVRKYAETRQLALTAIGSFIQDVRQGAFPAEDESYHLKSVENEKMHLYSS
jgi:3-methyl-2-oxobutanoate hydroxymethyltransferase